MTVTYTAQVATCRGFGCFLKLLFRWRGSIYKLVWLDLTCFLFLYYVLNIVYRTVLNEHQKNVFESIVKYCEEQSTLIPLSFVLGFYVSIVMTRWWNQYTSIPWPDSLAVFISANVHGQDERGRLMRRTVMRYVCLCLTMVLTNISPRVKKRFPTLQHLVEAGLLVENEKYVMESFNSKFTRHSKHWMPIVWAASIITRARKEGRIRDDFAVKTLIDELNKFRGQSGLLISFDTISIPLVYTQVVTLAVYSFFLTSCVGQQWTETKTVGEGFMNRIDLYFPIFTTLQFFFYMGWLKVAESLINPFGEDDDDFEVNWIIDRNLQVSYMIVDEMHHEHPDLIKDQYWDEVFPSELPYTTRSLREEHPQPSTLNVANKVLAGANVGGADGYGNLETVQTSAKLDEMVGKSVQSVSYKFAENDVEADDSSGIHFTAGRRMSQSKMGSTNSMASIAGTMTRVNTAASALKRLFSRDDSNNRTPVTPDVTVQTRLPGSVSSTSLSQMKMYPGGGSVKITDQVIEEVDEQLTITSMRNHDVRPTAQSLFQSNNTGPPPPSDPVDVPTSTFNRNVAYSQRPQSAAVKTNNLPFMFPQDNDLFMSASAPTTTTAPLNVQTPTSIYGTSLEDFEHLQKAMESAGAGVDDVEDVDCNSNCPDDDDHFEKLRLAREKERLERQKQKINRSISTQPPANPLEGELLLKQMGSNTDSLTPSNRNSIILDSNL